MEELSKKVSYEYCEKYDEEHTGIRFVTDWATKKEGVEKLIEVV